MNEIDKEFERDLGVASRAYQALDALTPATAMDEAIRAAARRQVGARPMVAGQSWVKRWSAPISAAALVVLTVSVGLVAIDEQPALAPEALQKAVTPRAAPVVVPQDRAAPATPPAEVKQKADAPMASPRQQLPVTEVTKTEMRRADAVGLASTEKKRAAPAPTVASNTALAEAMVSEAKPERQREEVEARPQLAPKLADMNTFADATAAAPQKMAAASAPVVTRASATAPAAEAPPPPVYASTAPPVAAVPPPVYAPAAPSAVAQRVEATRASAPLEASAERRAASAPVLLGRVEETPEAWIKRIVELKRLEKRREVEEELLKFRKRYPEFVLPEGLR